MHSTLNVKRLWHWQHKACEHLKDNDRVEHLLSLLFQAENVCHHYCSLCWQEPPLGQSKFAKTFALLMLTLLKNKRIISLEQINVILHVVVYTSYTPTDITPWLTSLWRFVAGMVASKKIAPFFGTVSDMHLWGSFFCKTEGLFWGPEGFLKGFLLRALALVCMYISFESFI